MIELSKAEIDALKKKPPRELQLNETVFLQGLKIKELEEQVAILIAAHTEPEVRYDK